MPMVPNISTPPRVLTYVWAWADKPYASPVTKSFMALIGGTFFVSRNSSLFNGTFIEEFLDMSDPSKIRRKTIISHRKSGAFEGSHIVFSM